MGSIVQGARDGQMDDSASARAGSRVCVCGGRERTTGAGVIHRYVVSKLTGRQLMGGKHHMCTPWEGLLPP